MSALRLGTRRSKLATTQSAQVAQAITELTGRRVELVLITAEGDDTSIPLAAQPRPGAFVATLRDALLAGRVDLVVHSFKDLPSQPLPGLVVAAIPERVDPRDALCSRHGLPLAQLPIGARVGTSSPRRAAGLLRVRPDLVIVPIRGNVDTRLGKVATGEVDAVVLAAAGLLRLGRADAITEFLAEEVLSPAPAQGALAVECRSGELVAVLAGLDHWPSRLAVTAERAVLAGIDAQCTTAIGAHASWLSAPAAVPDPSRLASLAPQGAGISPGLDRPDASVARLLRLAAQLHDHLGVSDAVATEVAAVDSIAAAVALGEDVAQRLLAGR